MLRCKLSLKCSQFELNVDFQQSEKNLVIYGLNGAGKTLLLRSLVGLERSAYGYIQIDDQILLDSESGVNLPAEMRKIAYLPQQLGLFPHLNVLQNVNLSLRYGRLKLSQQAATERSLAILTQFGVASCTHHFPHELSGGQAQRVALARALVLNPSLLLLDEPMSAQDLIAQHELMEQLLELTQKSDIKIVSTSHDPHDSNILSAKILLLDQGKQIIHGSANDLAQITNNSYAALWFKEYQASSQSLVSILRD